MKLLLLVRAAAVLAIPGGRDATSGLSLVAAALALSPLTRHQYRVAAGQPLELDLYRREGLPGPMPVVVVIHGGSWQRGDSSQLSPLNRYLAARGYAVAAVKMSRR